MTARIIVVTNQKGGSGKTTVAMHLAGTLARRDGRVLVVDADPQGTATRWASSSPDESPFAATVAGLAAAGGKVHREVRKFVEDYDYIVVDCPPAVDSPVPQSALLVADVALVPIIPSPPDLWAGVGIRELISNMADINEGLQARLVANMCQPNTTLAREVRIPGIPITRSARSRSAVPVEVDRHRSEATQGIVLLGLVGLGAVLRQALFLLGEFGIELATTQMHLRTVYRQAAVYGGTVHGLGTRAAAAVVEVESLTDEVLALTKERTHDEADHGRRVAG